MRCVCEHCGKTAVFEDEDGPFNAGWDWPPRLGSWGVISPRNCESLGCNISTTVWWKISGMGGDAQELTERQREVVARIVLERYLQAGAWDEKFDDPNEVQAALVWFIGEENGQ